MDICSLINKCPFSLAKKLYDFAPHRKIFFIHLPAEIFFLKKVGQNRLKIAFLNLIKKEEKKERSKERREERKFVIFKLLR